MNKTRLFLIASLLILFAQKAMADVNQPSPTEINQLTQQVIKNNPQFSDPNVVYPGDTVRIVEDGKTTIYTIGKWSRNAKDGCLWQIANSHLLKNQAQAEVRTVIAKNPRQSEIISADAENREYSELQSIAREISTLETKIVPKGITPKTEAKHLSQTDTDICHRTTWLIISGISAILLVFCLICIAKKYCAYTAKNPDKYAPVIPGGLPKDLTKAFELILGNYPRIIDSDDINSIDKKLDTISRGKLFRHFGAKKIEVQMAFEDGIRRIRVLNGESVHCVTFSDNSVYYFRSHSGNLYVLDDREKFHFPEGWGYIPEVMSNRIEGKGIS